MRRPVRVKTVFSFAQQAGIDPGQPRQRSRIELIILATALANQPHVPRMRHDHFVSQRAQLPADPG